MPMKKPVIRHHGQDVAVYRDVETDSRWYQRAVFYEVLVRGFSDASADGNGDLRGLTERLDYLQWLGVDCIWLLPFYQSPLRDGGYDISDFFTVLPEYGDLGDAVSLVEEAHNRGLRVIADLVMNHTSDQHPWFQMSRKDTINPNADWYVWSDDDQQWPDARVIFVDTERSNWSWDPQRQQYYWHRFFAHQPDLNYDNEEVQQVMLDVVRFWLDIGLDGFRLDAVPYLYKRDGTNCENLPETHDFLKRLRKEVDNTHPLIELFHALLFSLPGTPILYYGDEIGMGDNVYLGDRDSVRTPMQWSPDRNAGFSRAEFPQLYLPPLMDSVYGYPAVNVEAQLRDPSSLLLWVKRMLDVRRRYPVFGTGTFEVLSPENPAVLGFIRQLDETTVLCVNNLSSKAQPVEPHLERFEGTTPVELLGRVHFPNIGALPYLLTLAPYGFFWFELAEAEPGV